MDYVTLAGPTTIFLIDYIILASSNNLFILVIINPTGINSLRLCDAHMQQ